MADLDREIVSLGRRGLTDEALAVYHAVPAPTIRLLNSAIDACSRARPARLEEAFSLLKEGIDTKKLKPNVFTFGSLVSTCSRARQARRAIQVLRSMEVSSYCVCICMELYRTHVC
jgi:pentatricopeptide repeat protein